MGKIMRNGIQYGVDTADVLSTVAECDASASGGKGTTQVASAKALSELNSNLEEELALELSSRLGGITFGIDADGNYGYKKVGADTVIPFSRDVEVEIYTTNITAQKDYDYIILVMGANTSGNFHTWLDNALGNHGGEQVGYNYKDIAPTTARFGYRIIKGIKKGTYLGFYTPPAFLFCIGKKD